MTSRQATQKLLESLEIADKEAVMASLLPCIKVHCDPCALAGMELGSSRMGGTPDLPDSIEWPSWEPVILTNPRSRTVARKESQPLYFIAQISLDEVYDLEGGEDLPKQGLLYFFYDAETQPWGFDPNDRGSSRVFFYDGPKDTLKRRPPPTKLEATADCALTFKQGWSVRNTIHFDTQEDLFAFEKLLEELDGEGTTHRLLGQPYAIQNDMELECQLVTNGIYCGDPTGYASPERVALESGAADWRLLLQVDSDEMPGFMWGDLGSIYFWIKHEDLIARNFDKCWQILQCG